MKDERNFFVNEVVGQLCRTLMRLMDGRTIDGAELVEIYTSFILSFTGISVAIGRNQNKMTIQELWNDPLFNLIIGTVSKALLNSKDNVRDDGWHDFNPVKN